MSEMFPVVDLEGRVIGEASREECHARSFILHPVIHCIIMNSRGEWLLQKRSRDKDIQPGKWDTSVGGHVQAGESVATALRREVGEEVGVVLEPEECEFLHAYTLRSELEYEYVYTYRLQRDSGFCKQDSEVDELRFFTVAEIEQRLGSAFFTPNFEEEFARVKRLEA